MSKIFRLLSLVIGVVGFISAFVYAQSQVEAADMSAEETLARQILEATGVKGGLIAHIGCGDGRLTAALRINDSYIVHGLDTDANNIQQARKYIQSLGLYGQVSVERWAGKRLPYNDNLVNLVVSQRALEIPMDEILRVLVPHGAAYIKNGETWTKTVKPRPKEIDEWTHYLHDASGNAVAHDSVVGPPRHLQWVGSPRWARHHDHMASMSALVSANGRIFYIFDEGSTASIQLPPKWFLIARDAFNGVILWKQPIPLWNTHLWPLKSGPAYLPRRLVAEGDRVYVTLGLDAPLTALDAATGQTIRTYEGSKGTQEVITSNGVLFLSISNCPTKNNEFRPKFTYVWDNTGLANRKWAWDEQKQRIIAVQADTGNILWQKEYPVAPLTLAADGKCVYFYDGQSVICLNRQNGEQKWRSEPITRRSPIQTSYAPKLVVYQDVVLFSGGNKSMTALSAETGETLWTAEHPRSGHNSPEDLLVIDGLVWSGATTGGNDSGVFKGRDLHTGEVKNEFPPDVQTYWFHHRCHQSKATDRYLLPSRTGIEFVDFEKKHWTTNHWVRGGCIYGIMPCNGLVYAPPHACACYLETKLYGFCALGPEKESENQGSPPDDDRLETGPAYGQIAEAESKNNDDWPMYRHDPTRSGYTKTPVPDQLKRVWQISLGGKLGGVAIADNKVFVSSIDHHTVYALDAPSGEILWSYTTGGRVDSPPTIYRGMVLFGSVDGYVYCLNASDGKLSWRFRAAPVDRRLISFEQLESVWPVHGSVLVQNNVLYCVAGRSMFLDGGIHFLRLDPGTGRLLSETILDERDPETGENLQAKVNGLTMPVGLPDVLSSDGQHVYMRSQRFDLQGKRQETATRSSTDQVGEGIHLFSPIGFLDDTWFHRSYWLFGRSIESGWGAWFKAGRLVPSGRILAFDDSCVYGFARKPEFLCQSSVLDYQLYAADKEISEEPIRRVSQAERRMNATSKKNNVSACDWNVRKQFPLSDRSAIKYKWLQQDPPLYVRAMVVADKTLFIAGPPDFIDEEIALFQPDDAKIQKKLHEQDAAFEGQKGALLRAVSVSDGKKLAEYKLDAPPVFDGLAAANQRLYLATTDGKVLCFGGK